MNRSKFVALLIGLVGVTASAQALAEGGGLLLGGSLGRAQAKEDACSLDINTYSCDRTGKIAYSGFVALMVNRYFGMEVGYHDLGTLVEQNNATPQHAAVKTKLGEFVFVAAYPWLDRVSIYAKGGGYYARSTLTSDFLAPAQSKARQWTYGGGISWDVFRYAGLRLEYQRYNNVGGAEVGFHTDVELASVGAYLKF
jgi:hypothetical protein